MPRPGLQAPSAACKLAEPMASAVTISLHDLQALQRIASVPGHGDGGTGGDRAQAALAAQRKAASAARAAQWPNTLAGLRRRKEEAKSAALAAKEAADLELDAVMAEERLGERLSILRAANAFFAGQSDKVKALRNYQQRQMDLETNQANARVRARRAAGEQEETAAFHDSVMAQVAEGEAGEAGRRAAQRERARGVAEGLHAQVREAYAKRATENRAEVLRGLEVAADAKRMEEEAAAALAAKARQAALATRAFAADNARLAASRTDARAAEAAVDERVQHEVLRQEDKVSKIQGVLAAHREEAQRKARIISELVRARPPSQAQGAPCVFSYSPPPHTTPRARALADGCRLPWATKP